MKIIKISILAFGMALPILSFFFFRKRRKEIALALFSLAFSVFVAEYFLRQFYPQIMESDKMFEYDSSLGWKFISNKRGAIVYAGEARHWIKTNSFGFRDNSPPSDKEHGKKILVVGDSFVSNIAVEDSQLFTEIMERSLRNTSVLNFGVNGYGQVQEYLLLRKWLDKIEPDLVILMIYIRNDFNDNLGGYWLHPRPFVSWDEENQELVFHAPPQPRAEKKSMAGLLLKWLNESHFFVFLNRKFDALAGKYFHAREPSLYEAPEFYLCNAHPSRNTQLMQRIMEALLMRIAGYVDERGIPLAIALAPSIVQVEDTLWRATILNKSEDPENYKRTFPDDKLMRFAEKNNLLMIDLLPILRSMSNSGKPCYNRREQHWNAAGNRVVAQALIDYIKAKKLIADASLTSDDRRGLSGSARGKPSARPWGQSHTPE